LNAVQETSLRGPKIMANPGKTEQCSAAERGSYALHCVTSWREIRRQGIPDAPDIAATLEADVEFAIGTHAGVANEARSVNGRAVGENRSSAVKDLHLGCCIDDGSPRLGGRGHELKARDFLNSGNEHITVGRKALIVQDATGLYLVIYRRKNSRQIAGVEVQN